MTLHEFPRAAQRKRRKPNGTDLFCCPTLLFPPHLSSGLIIYVFARDTFRCLVMKLPAADGSAIQSRLNVRARQTQQTLKSKNMELFWFCTLLVLLYSLSVVVGEVTTHDGPLPMSTMAPANMGNITISPSLKGKNHS